MPSTVEDMAKFEISNYMGNLKTLWSVVSKGVQGRGFNQKEYEEFNKMLGNSFDNAQMCIRALKSGNNSLDRIELKK